MIVGIDLGGTTTKLIGYDGENILHPLTVKADDPIASAAGALGKYLSEDHRDLTEVTRIAITGVGAGYIGDSLLGRPVSHIGEFKAIGRGGTFLADIPKAIVVSMGTGTAIVEVDGEKLTRWGGTGIGGGTLVGLSKYILGITDVFLVSQKATQGRLDRIDLTVGDITLSEMIGLADSITASNFGKYSDEATEADLALAILNLVYQTIGVVAHGAAKATGNTCIILTGRLATLPQAEPIFGDLSNMFGLEFHIPRYAVFATAVGASILANSL